MSQVSEPYAPNTTVYWTTYTYDASGRPISVKAADNTSVTSYTYTGNTTLVTDAAGKWKKNTTDSFGNLINVQEPDTPHGYNNSTTYTYNGVNQLTQVSMQTASGTQTRTFTWSGADLVSATNPENGTVNYTYDGAHHVLTRTDAKNQQTQYTYDIYGRLIYIYHYPQAPAYPGDPNHPPDPSQQVSYYYDSNPFDGTFSTYAWGRLTSVAFGNACAAGSAAATAGYIYMYGYTTAGRVSAQRMRTTVNQSNPVNWSCSPITVDQNASYGWDSEGRMTSMAYPGGVASYQYQYEAMGHLNGMTDSLHSNATVATAAYGPAGEVDTLAHGGVTENFSYMFGDN
jgi:YD repeat-containing protein